MGFRVRLLEIRLNTYSLIYNTTGDGSSLKFPRLVSVNVTNSQNNSLPPLALSWNYIPAMDKTVGSPTVPLLQPTVIQSFGVRTFFASDLTGDGLSDLVELMDVSMQNQSGNGVDHLTGLNVYGNEDNSGSSVSFANPKSFSLDGVCTGWISSFNTVPTTADFDGDGINDMALSNFVVVGPDKAYRYRTLYGNKNSNSLQLSNTWSLPISSYTGAPLNVAADFNNDGYGDFLYLETAGLNNQCACHIIRGQERRDSLDYYSFQLTVDGIPLKMFCGDYNVDGLTDIMVVYVGGYTIYWNLGTTSDGVCFTKNNSIFDTAVHYLPYMFEGDFNGDGIPDLLMNGFGDYACFYYFALGNGDGTFTGSLAYTSIIHDQATSYDNNQFSFLVYDFDHDGKSDVVLSKAMYNNHNNFENTYVLWLRSTGTTLELVRQVLIHDIVDASPTNHMIGVFRGNGALELMSYGNDLYSNLINPYNSHQFRLYQDAYSPSTGKVGSFLDGYGNQTSVCYASLTNSSVYSKSEGYEFPLSAVKADISVVSQVCQTNGICPAESNSYFYEDLLMHRQGKGLLGFRKSQTTQSTRNLVTVHEQRFDSLYFVPVERNDSVFLDGSVSTTVSRNTLSPVSCTYGSFPNYSQTIDFDGYSVTTAWEYDTAKGMPTKETVTLDNVNQYKETTYSYTHTGGAWRPTITEVKSRNSSYSPVVTSRTTCSYDTTGRPLSVVENAQSTLALTTAYTYDNFGNVLTSVQTGQGISPVNTIHEYDGTHRFVSRTYTNPASTDISYTYNIWGNLLTETDNTNTSAPLTATHIYDGWGNRLKTTDPAENTIEYHTGWGTSASQKWFIVNIPEEGAWTKTWYDATGRETSTESKGMKNVDVTTSTTYDSRGRVLRKTSTEGTLTTWEEYGYDNRDRVTSITRSTGSQTSYTYVPRKVTEVTDGRTFEKSFDAWGNVIRIDDDEHGVSYSYRGDGKMTSALGDNRGGGGSYIIYDDAGNRWKLDDASAGLTTYTYNALGQIKKKTDARGKETTYRYDALNRLVSENSDGDSVVYVYGTSGNSKGRLSSMTRGNRTISYAYDKYGRTVSETRAFGLGSYNSYTFRYSHDKQGRLTSRTFPSMYADSYVSDTLRIEYTRNGYGQLIGMNQSGTGASLWRLDSYDGRNTVELLGDTIRRTTALNAYGYPQQVRMKRGNSTLRQMNYLHNAVTGNLTQRTSLFLSDDIEYYSYDTSDRLTQWEQDSHAPAMVMEYDYNGNIYRKTNVGQYQYGYDWHHPFAVESVTNAQGQIPSAALSTQFDGRGKISSIYEYGSWKEASLSYGPDGERWEMTIERPGEYEEYRKYLGDMEVTLSGPGMTRCNWYLGHGVMLFRDADNPAFSSVTPLYAYRDNQGSYIDFFRSNGTRVFEAKYDPWGVETVVRDSIGFHRGYGGHEMLNEFGIINMNGRLYDPLLGRFLSPDNYVQEPFNTQNLNRYSYCLNNPVKYADPSGEWFGLDDLLVSAFSFTAGYTANGLMTGTWGMSSVKCGLIYAGSAWLGYNLGGYATTVGITTATLKYMAVSGINTISSILLPPCNIPIGNHWSIGVSPGLMFSEIGFIPSFNISCTYHSGDFSITATLGASTTYYGGFLDFRYKDYGFGYGLTQYGATSFHGNEFGLQYVGTGRLSYKNTSFSLSNDLFGDKEDRWRTSAAELTIGKFSVGSYILTNWGKNDSSKKIITDKSSEDLLLGDNKKGAWAKGLAFSAPIWIGVNHNNQTYRIGYSHRYVQSLTQNFVHKYITPTPFFTDYEYMREGIYTSFGKSNKLSIWGF